MNSELGRRQREDQPAVPRVNVAKTEDVSEERSRGGCVLREQERVGSRDHRHMIEAMGTTGKLVGPPGGFGDRIS
jgi:hypothetical protein